MFTEGFTTHQGVERESKMAPRLEMEHGPGEPNFKLLAPGGVQSGQGLGNWTAK
jgi:hypothetical protein